MAFQPDFHVSRNLAIVVDNAGKATCGRKVFDLICVRSATQSHNVKVQDGPGVLAMIVTEGERRLIGVLPGLAARASIQSTPVQLESQQAKKPLRQSLVEYWLREPPLEDFVNVDSHFLTPLIPFDSLRKPFLKAPARECIENYKKLKQPLVVFANYAKPLPFGAP